MGCKELKITDYYRFWEPDEKSDSHAGEIPCTAEKNRYKPVFHTVISNYRYYSPELGRRLSRNPIEEDGGLNVYCFVSNNPYSYYDYLGQEQQDYSEEQLEARQAEMEAIAARLRQGGETALGAVGDALGALAKGGGTPQAIASVSSGVTTAGLGAIYGTLMDQYKESIRSTVGRLRICQRWREAREGSQIIKSKFFTSVKDYIKPELYIDQAKVKNGTAACDKWTGEKWIPVFFVWKENKKDKSKFYVALAPPKIDVKNIKVIAGSPDAFIKKSKSVFTWYPPFYGRSTSYEVWVECCEDGGGIQ